MERMALTHLERWKSRANRKPLIIRGARQVGKTELVRIFAKRHFENFIEINFDETPEKKELFLHPDVNRVMRLVEVDVEKKIIPGKTLLFLDEIQVAPEIFARLRYFYEKLPQLHIICAGSLLDFTLAEHSFSMPVGRIEYMFLGPMTFEEFLVAGGRNNLLDFLFNYHISEDIPQSIHSQLVDSLKDYFALGGMPGVLAAYFSADKDYLEAGLEQASLVQTYYDDFTKYQGKIDIPLLQEVFNKVPTSIGAITKYVSFSKNARASQISLCLDSLEKARLLYRVYHSAANGLPLAAEKEASRFKLLFLDIGLMNSMLGLRANDFVGCDDLVAIHSGSLAEQFIGQHLMYSSQPISDASLFFWMRSKKGATSEIDYLFSCKKNIVPVEVKSGKTGTLKSLQVFVIEKKSDLALRFNSEPPTLCNLVTSISNRPEQSFRLLSLPLYLVGQTSRLLEECCC
ncbi:MAG: ATP-binding protein [Spirochaetales bacterium]|nr:ATP-binding protein [Spirochaetales bacterium]